MGRPVLVLPEEIQAALRLSAGMGDPQILDSLLATIADQGWGYQPSATALGLHRQTVRQRAQRGTLGLQGLPAVPEAPRAVRPEPPALSEAERAELAQLNKLAQQLRAEHGEEDPRRVASERLSALIDELTKKKIRYKEIAEVLGVRPMTVRARLKRHGYRQINPKLTPYRGHRPQEVHA
jgi:transcriptional regulator of acetoin/glycerol metabolism